MKIQDGVYQVRINSKVLKSCLEHCKSNNVVLSEELRKVIEKFDRLNRKSKKGDVV